MKNSLIKQIISAVLTVLILLTVSAGVAAEYTDATVKSYEDQIKDASNNLKVAEATLADIRERRANVWEEIAQIDEIIKVQNQLKELAEAQLETIGQQIVETKANVENFTKLLG